jgi:TonB family protein
MNLKNLVLCLCLLWLAQISVCGQESPKNPGWVRIESENKEISFAVPDNFSFVFNKEGFLQGNPQNGSEMAEFTKIRTVTAFQNGATMFFESYDVKNAGKVLPYLLSNHPNAQASKISFGNFTGLQIIAEKGFYSAFYYLASDKNIYFIGVGARRRDTETMFRFLNSIRLNNKTVFNLPSAGKAGETGKTASLLDLTETPVEIVKMTKEEKKEMERKSKEARPDKSAPVRTQSNDADGLVILYKPRAQYTEDARQNGVRGVVALRAAFGADGKIEKITVIKELKHGLTEQAIKALRRIRFIPAEKENLPVVASKIIEYTFTIY